MYLIGIDYTEHTEGIDPRKYFSTYNCVIEKIYKQISVMHNRNCIKILKSDLIFIAALDHIWLRLRKDSKTYPDSHIQFFQKCYQKSIKLYSGVIKEEENLKDEINKCLDIIN